MEELNAASKGVLGDAKQGVQRFAPGAVAQDNAFAGRGPLATANVPPGTLHQAAQSFNTTNTTTINVNGAGNPMAVAGEISRRSGGSTTAYMGARAQPAS